MVKAERANPIEQTLFKSSVRSHLLTHIDQSKSYGQSHISKRRNHTFVHVYVHVYICIKSHTKGMVTKRDVCRAIVKYDIPIFNCHYFQSFYQSFNQTFLKSHECTFKSKPACASKCENKIMTQCSDTRPYLLIFNSGAKGLPINFYFINRTDLSPDTTVNFAQFSE